MPLEHFTDMITAYGWHYVVRVQRQTLCKNKKGVERQIVSLVKTSGRRVKMSGKVFKKYNWCNASVVVFWGKRYEEPLCIVSDLPASWSLIHRLLVGMALATWIVQAHK